MSESNGRPPNSSMPTPRYLATCWATGDVAEGTFDGIAQGALKIEQVVQ